MKLTGENLNFHKQKLYALILAGVGVIAMFLPWWKISFGGYGGLGGYSISGMHELGILAFIGFAGAGIATFVMGDKTKPYGGQEKTIVAACFGGAALITLVQFLRQTSFVSFGLFLALIAGILGALWVWGIVKLPENKKPPVV